MLLIPGSSWRLGGLMKLLEKPIQRRYSWSFVILRSRWAWKRVRSTNFSEVSMVIFRRNLPIFMFIENLNKNYMLYSRINYGNTGKRHSESGEIPSGSSSLFPGSYRYLGRYCLSFLRHLHWRIHNLKFTFHRFVLRRICWSNSNYNRTFSRNCLHDSTGSFNNCIKKGDKNAPSIESMGLWGVKKMQFSGHSHCRFDIHFSHTGSYSSTCPFTLKGPSYCNNLNILGGIAVTWFIRSFKDV